MVKAMMHETFYTSGTYVNPELGLWIGWVLHRGTFSDCMPVWNENRDICLIFIGENYADRADINRLRSAGHACGEDDASYLVHLYEECGFRFLEKLNGWFSGVLVDLRDNKTVLFNDRYGLSKIHHHEDAQRHFFSSEAKSLLKVFPRLRRLDPRGLGEFVACGCVLQNRTIFSGISVLPGATAWTFTPKQPVRKDAYFNQQVWEEQPQLSDGDFNEELSRTWAQVLPRYFRGKERIGLSLTGGVDSRMILACADRPEGTLPCYTFGGTYRDCMDVKLAREIARICKQPHSIISVGQEFRAGFPVLAERTVYISDGCMDVTGAIDLYVQRTARQIAPVRVTGTYGGEILRRLLAFKPISLNPEMLAPEVRESTRAAAVTYAEEIQGHKLSFTAFKQTPWHMCSKYSLERSQVSLRMPYYDNDLVRLSYQSPPNLVLSNKPSLHVIANANAALKQIATDRGLTIRSIPGMTVAQHLFQQFTFKAEYAYDYGMPQWVARIDHLFAPLHFERLFLGRHKFHHFRVWYRDELSGYVKEVLLDTRTRRRAYLHGPSLERIVRDHTEGRQNHTLEIHKLLSLELMQRALIDQG